MTLESLITLSTPAGDVRVLRARVEMPLRGAWQATLSTDTAVDVGTKVSIVAPGITLVGTVRRSVTEANRFQVLVLAGAGAQSSNVTAKEFLAMPLAAAVVDTCALLSESPADIPILMLGRWHRPTGAGGLALSALADEMESISGFQSSWRYTDDGKIAVVMETWANEMVVPEGTQVLASDAASLVRLTCESCFARPGQTWQGRKISLVSYVMDERRLRVELTSGTEDKTTAALRSVIELETRHTDAHAVYTMRVTAQNGQSVDLKSDSLDVPDMGRVPIRFGIPGMAVTIAPGAKVLVTYENGDRHRPVVISWDSADVTEIHFVLPTSSQPAVRGTSLATYLSNLTSWLSALSLPVSGTNAGPPGVPPPTPPGDLLSTKMRLE